MSDTTTCQMSVWSTAGSKPSVCGRPVKGDGLCGIHLRAKTKRAENRARWDAEWVETKRLEEVARELGTHVAEVIGGLPHVRAYYSPASKTTTADVIVSGEVLRELLNLAKRAKDAGL